MSQKSRYGLDNFLNIANSHINSDTSTIDGIERSLISWFCFKFESTPNDSRLLDMTLEELLVLYYMHKIKDNPDIIKDETTEEKEDEWEKFLKAEMRDDYETNEQMIETIKKHDEEYTKKVKEKFGELPNKVETDFSMLADLGDDNG